MLAQEYWNTIGSKKNFADPIYTGKLAPFLTKDSKILEFGCGYGRLMQLLYTQGFHNLTGVDFAPNMITRGKELFPHLDMRLLEIEGNIPFDDRSLDGIVLSTVLCCIPNKLEQAHLIHEIFRALKPKGILYLSDFLITDHPRYQPKYTQGLQKWGEWGIYTTHENLTVRHHTTNYIMELLNRFDIQWFEQFDFKTMNNNPIRTFHTIAQKPR